MLSNLRPLLVVLIAALGAACAGHPKAVVPATPVAVTPAASAGAAQPGDGVGGPVGRLPALPSTGPLSQTRILFEYDSAEIGPQYAAMLAAHGRLLAADPAQKARLEGNTDDRGSPEYNVGLGERRAQAVKRALLLHGASDQQLGTVSYGAERPAVEGDGEAAWAQNRRVDLVYLPRL